MGIFQSLYGELFFKYFQVLPSGIGHTTSCFLSVEGSSRPTPYILTEDETELEVQKVQKLAHALSQTAEKLSEDSLIRIYWPQNKVFRQLFRHIYGYIFRNILDIFMDTFLDIF